jgi:hypothetical protein
MPSLRRKGHEVETGFFHDPATPPARRLKEEHMPPINRTDRPVAPVRSDLTRDRGAETSDFKAVLDGKRPGDVRPTHVRPTNAGLPDPVLQFRAKRPTHVRPTNAGLPDPALQFRGSPSGRAPNERYLGRNPPELPPKIRGVVAPVARQRQVTFSPLVKVREIPNLNQGFPVPSRGWGPPDKI